MMTFYLVQLLTSLVRRWWWEIYFVHVAASVSMPIFLMYIFKHHKEERVAAFLADDQFWRLFELHVRAEWNLWESSVNE